MESFIKVTLETGVIAATERHKKTVLGLGLKYRHAVRVLKDTPAIRGMAQAVPHLVKWEKVKGPDLLKTADPFGDVPEFELGAVKALPQKQKAPKKIKAAPSEEKAGIPKKEPTHKKEASQTKKTTQAAKGEVVKKTHAGVKKKVTKKVKK